MMNRDHIEIGRLTNELTAVRDRLLGPRLRASDAKALRRILYGLSTLLRLHLEVEELYLSLLDACLTPEAAASAWESLKAATHMAQAEA